MHTGLIEITHISCLKTFSLRRRDSEFVDQPPAACLALHSEPRVVALEDAV
jgi:hypothetical protein